MAFALSTAAAAAKPARALQIETLTGFVRDSTGAAIPLAEVRLLELNVLSRTDDNGRFILAGLPRGEVTISIRRVGFHMAEGPVAIGDVDTLHVVLYAQEAVLEGIRVEERRETQRHWIEEFDHRRAMGIGLFVTRDEIERRHTSRPSDVLRDKPGIRFTREGIRFVSAGQGRGDCRPMIWLDGQRMPGLELDQLPANDIEAMELYRGLATTPGQFGNPPPFCGTIVVWSRIPGGRRP